jgi:hypothetical protein
MSRRGGVQDRLVDDVVGAVPTVNWFEPVDPQVGEQRPVELLDLRRTVQRRAGAPDDVVLGIGLEACHDRGEIADLLRAVVAVD